MKGDKGMRDSIKNEEYYIDYLKFIKNARNKIEETFNIEEKKGLSALKKYAFDEIKALYSSGAPIKEMIEPSNAYICNCLFVDTRLWI